MGGAENSRHGWSAAPPPRTAMWRRLGLRWVLALARAASVRMRRIVLDRSLQRVCMQCDERCSLSLLLHSFHCASRAKRGVLVQYWLDSGAVRANGRCLGGEFRSDALLCNQLEASAAPRSSGGGHWFRTRTKAVPRTRLRSASGPLASRNPHFQQQACVCRGVSAIRTRRAILNRNSSSTGILLEACRPACQACEL